jgi:homoserine kinase
VPKISADDARQLASDFHDMAMGLGTYKFAQWDNLTPAQRAKLDGWQWTLMNYSSDFSTQAIQISLDDLQVSLANIKKSTAAAKSVLAKIKTINKVVGVASAAAILAAAIMSGNPGGIASAAKGLLDQTTASDK